MKAINLIPREQQRGAGGAAGRSGGAAYALLGVLAVALLIMTIWTMTGRKLEQAQADAVAVEQQATAAQSQAAALAPYTRFASISQSRVQTIKQLADSRFDWAATMGELARVLPGDVWLTKVTGTTAPGVALDGGGGGGQLRQSLAVPALELDGCTAGQAAVSAFMARLRLMNNVQRVSLQKSDKTAGDAPEEVEGPQDPCKKPGRANFTMVVFYDNPVTPPGQTGTAAGAPATAATTATTSTTATTPGATSTTSTTSTTGGSK